MANDLKRLAEELSEIDGVSVDGKYDMERIVSAMRGIVNILKNGSAGGGKLRRVLIGTTQSTLFTSGQGVVTPNVTFTDGESVDVTFNDIVGENAELVTWVAVPRNSAILLESVNVTVDYGQHFINGFDDLTPEIRSTNTNAMIVASYRNGGASNVNTPVDLYAIVQGGE